MSSEERFEAVEAELAQVRRDHEELIRTLEAMTSGTTEASGTPGEDESAGEESVEVACCSWADQADAEAWAALMDWADWLTVTYQTAEPFLTGCWTRHAGVVEDLAGLKLAWEHAVSACAEVEWGPTETLEYWHDRYLPGFIHRARSLHGLQACQTRHESTHARPAVTDRDGAVVSATGEKVA